MLVLMLIPTAHQGGAKFPIDEQPSVLVPLPCGCSFGNDCVLCLLIHVFPLK